MGEPVSGDARLGLWIGAHAAKRLLPYPGLLLGRQLLKKNLNCSYSTSGRKLATLYFWLRMTLAGNRARSLAGGHHDESL